MDKGWDTTAVCDAIQKQFDRMSPEERAEADHLQLLVQFLDTYISEFEASVLLLDYLAAAPIGQTEDELLSPKHDKAKVLMWPIIVARDAAITLYNFEQTLKAIQSNIRNSPIIRAAHNAEARRSAQRIFDKYFKETRLLRNAIAHAAQQRKTLATYREHARNGVHHEWSFQRHGRVQSLTLSAYQEKLEISVTLETVNRLREIQQELHSAFSPLLM